MTTTLTYLDALRAELRDLPAAERDDLLDDVASSGEDDATLEARLGPPAAFARELRSAAGLQSTPAPSPAGTPAVERVAAWIERARPVAHELAPLGWVARGYLAAVALAFLWNGSWLLDRPGVFAFQGDVWDAFWLCVACIAASVAVGVALRLARRRVPWMTAVNVLFALGALLVIPKIADQFSHRGGGDNAATAAAAAVATQGLNYNGSPVVNVYPYDRAGRPLYDVRLYDQNGNPLDFEAGSGDTSRRVPETRGGVRAYNAFPVRYFKPGTERVERPRQGFVKRQPRLVRPKALRAGGR